MYQIIQSLLKCAGVIPCVAENIRIRKTPPYENEGGRFVSMLVCLLYFALARLICNTAGCFAGRLAGCLAFATAANCYALFQVTCLNGFDSLHGFHLRSHDIYRFLLCASSPNKKSADKNAYTLKKYITTAHSCQDLCPNIRRFSPVFSHLVSE